MTMGMKLKRPELKRLLANEKGMLLVAGLVLLAAMTMVGTTAYLLSSTDIKIGANFKNSQQALRVAQAGAERGREILRKENGDEERGPDPTSFNSELIYYAAGNVPIATGTLNGYNYTVRLRNDWSSTSGDPYYPGDPGGDTADSNNKVLLVSTATDVKGRGVTATVEIAVTLPPPPSAPPPASIPNPVATIALLGDSGTFMGGSSNAKSLNGDDQCGNNAPLPVVQVSAAGSLSGVQSSISSTKPETYHTKVNGQLVDATTNMNDIAKSLTAGEMVNNGTILNNATSLNNMIDNIRSLPQATILPGGSTNANADLGSVSNLKITVVDGDFTMNAGASGAGILVVKGQLNFHGNINFTGIIMVIGKGQMVRNGGGNGTISGTVWVANTAGPDGIVGNADDAMGAAQLNTSGGGASNFQYCSSAVNNAISATAPPPTYDPLQVTSYRQVL